MSIPFNTPLRLSTEAPARSWMGAELLGASTAAAATHQVSGIFTLTEEDSYVLNFVAKLTSDLTELPVTVHYTLPALSRNFDADRPHTIAEAIAEIALAAADDHDSDQGELIRLIGLRDAVALKDIAMLDIV